MRGPQLLPRLIPGVARWHLYTGNYIIGSEAYRLGKRLKEVPRNELLNEANRMTKQICESSPDSIPYLKESIETGRNLPIDHALPASVEILKRYEQTRNTRLTCGRSLRKKARPLNP